MRVQITIMLDLPKDGEIPAVAVNHSEVVDNCSVEDVLGWIATHREKHAPRAMGFIKGGSNDEDSEQDQIRPT